MNAKQTKKIPSLVKDRFKNHAFIIPSLVTATGIFCGFLAVLSALNGQLRYATGCIALSFFLDGLDGRIARRLNATSDFGRELDSLSDLVAFGMAPAVLVYVWAFQPAAGDFGVLVTFAYLVCGASRLARFNVREQNPVPNASRSFEGLPIPAAAATVASLVFAIPNYSHSETSLTFVSIFMLSIAVLMVSSISYGSPKYLKLSNISPRFIMIIISAAVAIAWYNAQVVFITGFMIYVLSGPLIWVYSFLKSRFSQKTTTNEDSDSA